MESSFHLHPLCMKSKNSFQIQIPEPCSEDWKKMTQAEKGRFCGSCAKIVVDFTKMTDNELIDFFVKDKGKTCGRFRSNQLNKTYIPTRTQTASPLTSMAFASALTVITAAAASAQTEDSILIEHETIELSGIEPADFSMGDIAPSLATEVLIRGRLMHNGQAVSNAAVTIEGHGKTTSNAEGYFEMTVLGHEAESLTLSVEHAQYWSEPLALDMNTQFIEIEMLNQPIEIIELDIKALPNNYEIEGIIRTVISPIPEKKKWWQLRKKR